jgi:hypothetical protein
VGRGECEELAPTDAEIVHLERCTPAMCGAQLIARSAATEDVHLKRCDV